MRQQTPRQYLLTLLALGSVGLSLDSQTADAQLPAGDTLCYRFDRPYFHWTVASFVGDSGLLDSATVVRDSFEVGLRAVHLKVLSDGAVVPWRVVSRDSSAIVMLSSQRHQGRGGPALSAGARTLVPPTMRVDSAQRNRWLDSSYWRTPSGDTLQVVWRNGLSGPVFRLQVRGDTLQGHVRFTTDIAGRQPQEEPARALRVVCPS